MNLWKGVLIHFADDALGDIKANQICSLNNVVLCSQYLQHFCCIMFVVKCVMVYR